MNFPKKTFTILFFIIVFLSFQNIAWADKIVSSDITSDTTWHSYDENGVIIITKDIDVYGATLTIEPGAVIFFELDARLSIGNKGTTAAALIANGTLDEPIYFESLYIDAIEGDWDGIYFGNNTDDDKSIISNGAIAYADYGIRINNANPEINSTVIFNCAEKGIYATNSSAKIIDNYFVDILFGDGLTVENFGGTIENNYFENIGNNTHKTAIEIRNSATPLTVNRNYIFTCYSGIDSYDTSNCRIENNIIYDNDFAGMQIDYNSDVEIINNTIVNNGFSGIILYHISGFPSTAKVVNNNIAFNNTYGLNVSDSGSTILSSYNNLYNNNNNYNNCSPGTGDISVNPKFFDEYYIDIRHDSPLIDKGTSIDTPDEDFRESNRPFDGDADGNADKDIGAREFNLTAVTYIPNVTKKYFGWTTPYIIQNIGDDESYVQCYNYNRLGSEVFCADDMVAPGSSFGVNPNSYSDCNSGFSGSAIIWSENSLGTIVNEHSNDSSMAFEGINSVDISKNIYLPNITRDYFGWTTPFIIQNLGTKEATINISYFRKGESNPSLEETITAIGPGSSVGINPSSKASLGKFQGSVVIEGSQNISAVVNEHHPNKQSMSYNGFANGSGSIYLPNITSNYFGWTTPFAIQNLGTENVTVTVEFYKKGEASPTYTEEINALSPGSSCGINPAKISALGIFQGSVVAKTSGGEIVAVCNEHSKTDSMAYSGVGTGASTNYLPNITRSYFGWTTPFVVQNLDLVDVTVSVKFFDSTGILKKTLTNKLIPKGTSLGFNPGSFSDLGKSFKGSVVVKAQDSKKISSIVNEHQTSGQAMSYNGF